MSAEVIRRNLVVRGSIDAAGGVFSNGVPVGGGGGGGGADAYEGVPLTKGTVIHVDSTHTNAADTNDGKSKDRPMKTIDAAVAKCTANKGDVILVSAGHAETIAAANGIDLDIAGISVIGLGQGENRPTITFATLTTATMRINAANVTARNLLFKVNVDSLAIAIDVDKVDCEIGGCEFREGTAKQWLTCIDLNGGAANAVDRARIVGNRFFSLTAGADNAIKLAEVADQVIVMDNLMDGDFTDAAIHNPTGKVLTNLYIQGNTIRNRQTGDHAVELVSACTGMCVGNALCGDTAAAILDPGSLFCAGNMAQMAIDKPGFSVPLDTEDQVTNVLGVDDADNAFASTNVVANKDGTVLERLEDITAELSGAGGIATYPAAAAPANAVSLAEVMRAVYDRQAGDGTNAATNSLLGKRIDRTTADVQTAAAVPLFTISGGRVLVTMLTGKVTTIIGAGVTNAKFQLNPTTGTTNDLCANLDIDADEAGALYSITGTPADAMLRSESGAVRNMSAGGVICDVGDIEFITSADRTGSISFQLFYLPLDNGAAVAAV